MSQSNLLTHLHSAALACAIVAGTGLPGASWTASVALAQDDPVDVARTERYVARLSRLQEARMRMRDQATSLAALNPNLQQDLHGALQTSLIAAGALETTPPVTVAPTVMQSWGIYRGQDGLAFLQPELMLWYTLQDNTLIRYSLLQSLANSQRNAAQTYVTLEANLAALEQIAHSSDENFLQFRQLSDVLGRRSPLELEAAEQFAADWLKADPLHAGAALVRAHALRAMERYDECTELLDTLDNNFPAMQAIHSAVAAQIAFLGGDIAGAKRALDKGLSLARSSGAGEPYLISGWLAMAERDWKQAKNYATRLRALSPNDLETAILEALATAYDRPSRSRDALQILRRARLNSSPDDWHYHEALAIVHSLAGDRQLARREIANAVTVAPSHLRAELEREQQDILAGKTPAIDWQVRLTQQWLPAK